MDANGPLRSPWSSQLAAALPRLPNSATQTSLQDTHTHTRETLPVSAPRSPDVGAHMSVAGAAGPPATACPSLADALLERIKGRLQDRARPGQVAALPQDPVPPLSLGAPKDGVGGVREEQQSQTRAREVEPRRQHLPSEAQVGDGRG